MFPWFAVIVQSDINEDQWSYYRMAKFKCADSPQCNTSATSKASRGQWWKFELLAELLVWHPKVRSLYLILLETGTATADFDLIQLINTGTNQWWWCSERWILSASRDLRHWSRHCSGRQLVWERWVVSSRVWAAGQLSSDICHTLTTSCNLQSNIW